MPSHPGSQDNPFALPIAGQDEDDPFAVLRAASEPSKVAAFTKEAAPVLTGLGPRRNAAAEDDDGPGTFVSNERESFKKGPLKGADKGLFFAGLSDAVLALSGVQGQNVSRVAGEREAHLDREARREQLFDQREQRRNERKVDKAERVTEITEAEERNLEREQRRNEHEETILKLEQGGLKLRGEQDLRLSTVGDAFSNLTRYGIGKLPDRFGDPVAVANTPRLFSEFMRFIGDARQTQILSELEAREKASGGSGKLTVAQTKALATVRSSATLFANGMMPADPSDPENVLNLGSVPLPGTDPANLESVARKAQVFAAGTEIDFANFQDVSASRQAFQDEFLREFTIFNSQALGFLTEPELWDAERAALMAQAGAAFDSAVTQVAALKNQAPPPPATPAFSSIPLIQQLRKRGAAARERAAGPESSRSQTRAGKIIETSKKGRAGMRSAIEEFSQADAGTQAALEQINPELVAFIRARIQ